MSLSKRFRLSIGNFFLCVLLCCLATAAGAEGVRFFAVGDLPYQESEYPQLDLLFAQASTGGAAFLVHVGDLKSGSAPCTDRHLARIAEQFRRQPLPVVYTLGDNEWTDCRRRRAGGHDPMARLVRVRQVFFDDPGVLRLDELGTLLGDELGLTRSYPEIFSFSRDGVMIVALHVVGSDNNFRRNDPRALAEMRARDRANTAMLARAGADAEARGLRAMVILMHADPLFERSKPSRGFASTLDALVGLMSDYSGRVLLIHGDTHRFRHDRPLLDRETGVGVDRFERAEVPGSPRVGGLWVGVDPEAAEPFEVEVVYPSSRDLLLDP